MNCEKVAIISKAKLSKTNNSNCSICKCIKECIEKMHSNL